MHHVFLNGPVQNGSFTFATAPGKAVGILLAEALNGLLGTPPAPHLWNTVTLAGDLRHRQHGGGQARESAEAHLVAAKYTPGPLPQAGTVTDADAEVADFALEMIEDKLRAGLLAIGRETVPTCRACGHMTGHGTHPCNSCGGAERRDHTSLHLVAEPAGDYVLDRSDIHASHRRPPEHLRSTAGRSDRRLVLSRTRDHGIDLSPLGFPGLVLDPRAGVHATVFAVARRRPADVAVMTITENAANHIAAHGRHFREHDGIRLRYALHGRVPYARTADFQEVYEAHRADTRTRAAFESWFLPLYSLKQKSGVRPDQLRSLFKHFIRSRAARPAQLDVRRAQALRLAIVNGDTEWAATRAGLTTAVGMAAPWG